MKRLAGLQGNRTFQANAALTDIAQTKIKGPVGFGACKVNGHGGGVAYILPPIRFTPCFLDNHGLQPF